ncbi:MAG: sigma-54-dependent transcriptional regulator [Acidobacteriota bacterium]
MKILIVDDEETARYGIRKSLGIRGKLYEAANLRAAGKILEDETLDLVLLDLNLGGENGFELFEQIQQQESAPKVIIITAHGNEKTAVEAMKRGAFDYLAKPFDIDELRLLVRNVAEQVQLRRENQTLKAKLAASSGYGEMIGSGEAMMKVYDLIDKIAETDVTVLLTGESGSGKELVAREIHRNSPRVAAALVSVNCAAIPENLMESELFGHEKGAFTGATQKRIGKFEQARGGTLFLDEIGDMAPDTQAKILRALEEKRIERLGSNEAIDVDVRIISATNKDLKQMVADREFRADLYYRLEVIRLDVPPLRRHKEDIPALINYFLNLFAHKHGRERPDLTARAMARLATYHYPGNVRQLRNMLERLLILNSDGPIDEKDLPEEVRFFVPSQEVDFSGRSLEPFFSLDFKNAREAFEVKYLLWKLRQHENNITHTAEAIGIHRQSLQQKIKDLGLRRLMDL